MPNNDYELKSDLDDELDMGKRINFRDYPSTGLVVLAALVSGVGWLAYKWAGGKRQKQGPSSNEQQQEGEASPKASSHYDALKSSTETKQAGP
jgi:hypothetical protein